MVRSWQARYIFILKITVLCGFSEAYYPHLASGTRGNYFDYISEPALHDQYYSPDYFDQAKRFGHFWPYRQSNAEYHLQKFNNPRYFHDRSSAESSKELNHVYEGPLFHQQSELQELANIKNVLLQVHDGEHQHINNHDTLNFPKYLDHLNYNGKSLQYNHQNNLDKLENLHHSQFHNSEDENHHMNNQDYLNYLHQYQQLNYPGHDHQLYQQGGFGHYRNSSQPQLQPHNSREEYKPEDNHDKLSYFSEFQQSNSSAKDQQLNHENEYRVVSQTQLHAGKLHQSDSHDKVGHTNQFEQHNYPGPGQLDQKENFKSSEVFNQPKINNSIDEHPKVNSSNMENHPIKFQGSNHSNLDHHFNQQGNTEEHSFLGDHQQHSGNELQQQNTTSEPSKFSNYRSPSQYPHQPLNHDHETPNRGYGHQNDFQQLNNIGLHQQLDQRNLVDESQHLKEFQLSRYPRDQQPVYHGNMFSASALQNGENNDPLRIPSNLHQMHQDQSGKIYYRNSPEKFHYSGLQQQKANPAGFMQLNEQLGKFGQFMRPGDFSNPRQFGQFMDPSRFSIPGQLGKFMDPIHFRNPAQIGPGVAPSHFSNSGQLGKLMDPTHFPNPSQFGQLMNPSHFSNPTQFGQFMNPSHFSSPNNLEQLNYQNMFRRFRHPNNLSQRSYNKREDFRDPVAGDSLNKEYSVPGMSGQQDYLKQTDEHKSINVTGNARDVYYRSDLQQLFNPANLWPLNQQNPFTQTKNGSQTQFRSHAGESQKPNNNNGNPSVTPTNVQSDQQEQQKQPNQAVDSTEQNLPEQNSDSTQLQELNNPDSANQPNTLLPEQLGNLNETQINSNSTGLNNTNEPQKPNLEMDLNNYRNTGQKILPHMVQHFINSSELLLKGNLSQFLSHVNPFKPDGFPVVGNRSANLDEQRFNNDFTTHQQEDNTGELQATNSQDQSQIPNDQQTPKEQNSPSQMKEPVNPSENNKTGDQSQFPGHGLVDQFQRSLAAINPFANGDEHQPSSNSTNNQPQNPSGQNPSDISNSNAPVNGQNSTSQQPDPNNREQRHLEFPVYPSPMQYFYRSNQPHELNPFNQIDKTNFYMEPMDPYNHHGQWTENQDYKNFVPPSICYLEKTHGPCNGAVPSFFFNYVTKRCEQFIYGGCYGNANNFATLEECESICMTYPQEGFAESKYPQQWHFDNLKYEDPALPLWHPGPDLVHEFCSLDKMVGPCRAIFRRYFFNPITKECEEFIYGGCYGNANNFFTKEECEFVCKSY